MRNAAPLRKKPPLLKSLCKTMCSNGISNKQTKGMLTDFCAWASVTATATVFQKI